MLTFFIYIRAGRTIYLKHKQLNNFGSSNDDPLSTVDALATIKTTEVSVTTEVRETAGSISLQPLDRRGAPDVNNPNSNGLYTVTISADTPSGDIADVVLPIQHQQTHTSFRTPAQRANHQAKRRNRELNSAAWSYTKCSILFFTAILITWIPSSANRVYSLIHQKRSSAPLEFMSAFVLPLQGFWNALIYAVTSWNACKNLWADLRLGRRPDVTELVGGMAPDIHIHHHHRHSHNLSQFKPSSRSNKTYETESMTELANSRPNSDDERDHPHHHRHVEHV